MRVPDAVWLTPDAHATILTERHFEAGEGTKAV
jgi:hypothetical protein